MTFPLVESNRRWRLLPMVPFLLIAMLIAINPVGFIGGDADDLQYLEAARCWVSQGPCLPSDHWQGRWPIIAPLAAVIALLGEGRWTIAMPTLAASLLCLALVQRIARDMFGRTAAIVAASLLAMTPVFVLQTLDPNVDSIELAFLLSGVAAMLQGRHERSLAWPALCGLAFALACQTRETSLALAPAALLTFALIYPLRRDALPWLAAAAAFALPFLIETLVYVTQTGDPLWRRRLSLGHTQIATTELSGRDSLRGSPFFNRKLIAHWRHEPGISIHWAIDGLLNLIVNPRTMGLFFLLPALAAMVGKALSPGIRRVVGLIACAAFVEAAIIVYVFAIDPKPRMMLPAVALAAIAISPLLAHLLKSSTAFASLLIFTLAMIAVVNILSGYRSDRADRIAATWIEQDGPRIETARQSYRRLTYQPQRDRLAPLSADRPLVMLQVNDSCAGWLDSVGIDSDLMPIVKSAALGTYPETWVERQAHWCVFRYVDKRSHLALRRALGEREWAF